MRTSQKEQVRKTNQIALKHLELEGISPSEEMLEDMELLNIGTITKEEFLARGIKRAKRMNDNKEL